MSMAEAFVGTVVSTKYSEFNRSKYEAQVKELNAQAEEIAKSGLKDEFGYIITGVSKLTSMMLDSDQHEVEIDRNGEPILVDRVIKVNRYVKSIYLNLHGIDHVVLGGLFLVAPVYLLPAEKVEAASTSKKCLSIVNPTKYGLPSEDECHYGTIKKLTHNAYIAIAKFPNNYVNELVNSVRHYEYVFFS